MARTENIMVILKSFLLGQNQPHTAQSKMKDYDSIGISPAPIFQATNAPNILDRSYYIDMTGADFAAGFMVVCINFLN